MCIVNCFIFNFPGSVVLLISVSITLGIPNQSVTFHDVFTCLLPQMKILFPVSVMVDVIMT
jgi:hypothetical protein